ncbi:hypothetical protein PVK06_023442 [Gossypium arboreum]|uniref:Uncharacterized protein n=2 Tax=Gossypium TaxID=3633 RepID=A0ABR0PBF9_GOSAR|nr:hypothetical protein PVK06_023442 [Gossypium arboreum]
MAEKEKKCPSRLPEMSFHLRRKELVILVLQTRLWEGDPTTLEAIRYGLEWCSFICKNNHRPMIGVNDGKVKDRQILIVTEARLIW